MWDGAYKTVLAANRKDPIKCRNVRILRLERDIVKWDNHEGSIRGSIAP